MNVLAVGGQSYFVDHMLVKLRKEGHRVSILSGREGGIWKYARAYEQYDFRYDNKVLSEIIESANPQAVLFFGAYDSNFPASMGQREVVSYVSSLMNILSVLAGLKKSLRFIYLSSQEVFGDSFQQAPGEDALPNPVTPWQQAIYQGELCCGDFGKAGGVETLILRLDHVYGKPQGPWDLMEPLASMCREGLFFGCIHGDPQRQISLLHARDAVEYIYTLMSAGQCRSRIYHISSGNLMEEAVIAADIAQGLRRRGAPPPVKELDKGGGAFGLAGHRYREEFGQRVFDQPSKSLIKISSYIRDKQGHFFPGEQAAEDEERTGVWKRIWELVKAAMPYIENTLMFLPVFWLAQLAAGSEYFAKLDFYLLYVLLFAIVFGQQQAAYSAILATMGYVFGPRDGRSGFEVVLDYNTYVWISQIFILGLVVGNLKDRLAALRGEHEREIQYVTEHLEDITAVNAINVRIKNTLENQIVNQNDSLGKLYEITSALERYAPDEVLFHAAEVVRDMFGCGDVAIYSISNARFARLSASTSVKAKLLGNSIEYKKLGVLYEDISQGKVFVNRSLRPELPLMANGIFSEEKLELMVLIWGLPMEKMTLNQVNMLRVAGYMVQNAVLRANRYLNALDKERYKEGTRILKPKAFLELARAHRAAALKSLAESSLIRLELEGVTAEQAAADLDSMLRDTDYIGQLENGQVYLLLANTGPGPAAKVVERMAGRGYRAQICGEEELWA